MGTMVDFLKHEGTTERERERLKMSVKTPASWNAHALSTGPGMPSESTALRIFTCLKDRVTSVTEMESALRGGNVHSSWFVPFKTCDVVDALSQASCIVGVELFFNLVLYCPLAALMDVFPDLKADVRADKAARTSLLIHGFWFG